MNVARSPRSSAEEKLIFLDSTRGDFSVGSFEPLFFRSLRKGDVLVMNDAATLPAVFFGLGPSEELIEVRLVSENFNNKWFAVVFVGGDWTIPTEIRSHASLRLQDKLRFPGMEATVHSLSTLSPALVELSFHASRDDFIAWLYRHGRPIQYSYLKRELSLFEAQTCYASRPWSIEMPSAGHAITWKLIDALRKAEINVATLTHAAGVSSIGTKEIDSVLPLPERFEIPAQTVDLVREAKKKGHRVIAVGTSVCRALEGSSLALGSADTKTGVTDLKLSSTRKPQVVDGLLTGIHEPETSHFSLLEAFASRKFLNRAYAAAEEGGFYGHEFGDSMLII